jgi:hypothetical protein
MTQEEHLKEINARIVAMLESDEAAEIIDRAAEDADRRAREEVEKLSTPRSRRRPSVDFRLMEARKNAEQAGPRAITHAIIDLVRVAVAQEIATLAARLDALEEKTP